MNRLQKLNLKLSFEIYFQLQIVLTYSEKSLTRTLLSLRKIILLYFISQTDPDKKEIYRCHRTTHWNLTFNSTLTSKFMPFCATSYFEWFSLVYYYIFIYFWIKTGLYYVLEILRYFSTLICSGNEFQMCAPVVLKCWWPYFAALSIYLYVMCSISKPCGTVKYFLYENKIHDLRSFKNLYP